MGQLDEAIADFTAVLELEPDHVKAAYARGACRNLKGEFAPAIGEPDSIRHWRPGSASLSERGGGLAAVSDSCYIQQGTLCHMLWGCSLPCSLESIVCL